VAPASSSTALTLKAEGWVIWGVDVMSVWRVGHDGFGLGSGEMRVQMVWGEFVKNRVMVGYVGNLVRGGK
jgi:hypothetical protein